MFRNIAMSIFCDVAKDFRLLNKPDELRAHVGAVMRVGATQEEVAEVIIQMLTYAGVPTMIEGLRALKAELEANSVEEGK